MVSPPTSRYFACSGGITTRMQCPKGLLFNSKIGSCDLSDNVECVLDVSVGHRNRNVVLS